MDDYRNQLSARLRDFVGNARAATAIEYALMASGISVAIISTVWALGSSVKTNLYDKLSAMF